MLGKLMRLAQPDLELLKNGRVALKQTVQHHTKLVNVQLDAENAMAAQKLKDLKELSLRKRAEVDSQAQAERDAILRGLQV